MTKIEWTDRTWNPIVGCSIVSPACTNCYAMKQAARITRMNPALERYKGVTYVVNGKPIWTGKVNLAPDDVVTAPLHWKKPQRVFVNSMSDLFHEAVPDAWIDRIFAVMALAPQHTFQVLTKRPARMREYITRLFDERCRWVRLGDAAAPLVGNISYSKAGECAWPLPNVWLGVTVEDQARADERIPDLLTTPAAVHFVSYEPALGPVDFTNITIDGDSEMDAIKPARWEEEIEKWRGSSDDWEAEFLDWYDLSSMPQPGPIHKTLDWIIGGGESGPDARPAHSDWFGSVRDQCAAAGVPFFFKQWGEWSPAPEPDEEDSYDAFRARGGRDLFVWKDGAGSELIGKARAGRLLDGREHNAFPHPTGSAGHLLPRAGEGTRDDAP